VAGGTLQSNSKDKIKTTTKTGRFLFFGGEGELVSHRSFNKKFKSSRIKIASPVGRREFFFFCWGVSFGPSIEKFKSSKNKIKLRRLFFLLLRGKPQTFIKKFKSSRINIRISREFFFCWGISQGSFIKKFKNCTVILPIVGSHGKFFPPN